MILSRDSRIARYYATSSWIFTTNKVLMVRDIWLKDSDIGYIAYSCKGKYSNRNILKITGIPLQNVQYRAKPSGSTCSMTLNCGISQTFEQKVS